MTTHPSEGRPQVDVDAVVARVKAKKAAKLDQDVDDTMGSIMTVPEVKAKLGEVEGMQSRLVEVEKGIVTLSECAEESGDEVDEEVTQALEALHAEKEDLDKKLAADDLYPRTDIATISDEVREGMAIKTYEKDENANLLRNGLVAFGTRDGEIPVGETPLASFNLSAFKKTLDGVPNKQAVVDGILAEASEGNALEDGELEEFERLLSDVAELGEKFGDKFDKTVGGLVGWHFFDDHSRGFVNSLKAVMGFRDGFVDESYWRWAGDRISHPSAIDEITEKWKRYSEISSGIVSLHEDAQKPLPRFLSPGRGDAKNTRSSARASLENLRGVDGYRMDKFVLRSRADAETAARVDADVAEAMGLIRDNLSKLRKFVDPKNRPKLYAVKRYISLRDALQSVIA